MTIVMSASGGEAGAAVVEPASATPSEVAGAAAASGEEYPFATKVISNDVWEGRAKDGVHIGFKRSNKNKKRSRSQETRTNLREMSTTALLQDRDSNHDPAPFNYYNA